jgi:exonuclease III
MGSKKLRKKLPAQDNGPAKNFFLLFLFLTICFPVTEVLLKQVLLCQVPRSWWDEAQGSTPLHSRGKVMDNLTVSCINCNSLNMSDVSKINQNRKLLAISKLKTDIILLSDIRLSNKNKISCSKDLEKCFRTNPFGNYHFLHNSTKNKRGVGVLISNRLNATVGQRIDDIDENYLLVELRIGAENIIVGAIYGPNNTDQNFFTRLKQDINILGANRLVLGGDWNATPSCEEVGYNIDIINMRDVPNQRHSEWIRDICTDFNLIDPFRYKYPDSREYTFIPRSILNKNRSRIDFFMIHESFTDRDFDCVIDIANKSNMFDHRSVTLTLNKKCRKKSNQVKIDSRILSDDLVDLIIQCTVFEAYLIHTRADAIPRPEKNRLLETIGLIKNGIKLAGPPKHEFLIDIEDEASLEIRLQRINNIKDLLGILAQSGIVDMALEPEPDIFMETLLFMIKNELIVYQFFAFKCRNAVKNKLESDIMDLKNVPVPDIEKITLCEKRLEHYRDDLLKKEIEKFASFDAINNEKITPRFLCLAKSGRKEGSVTLIRNTEGNDFQNVNDRERFIYDYFKNVFAIQGEKNRDMNGRIEGFLGPDICAHPVVLNSKLTEEEKNNLEVDFSVAELDEVSKDLNLKSAGGLDGINNALIKKMWNLIRTPLCNYANFCVEKGSLTNSFNSSVIRLIPKKGDLGNIKNWRPISLLNCTYKIISKAINNRLKKVANRILSRAQKGFVPKRYIQECLINIIETVNYCEKNKIESFLLALDMAKAFDSIRHDFLTEVYKFFGFGIKMIKILEVFTTGRKACIFLEDDKISNEFDLENGSTQGNAPSPLQFNFGEQVLIFKLELDPRIESVFNPNVVRGLMGINVIERPLPIPFSPENRGVSFYESNRETDKLEGFADDGTEIGVANEPTLGAIKENLENFEILSGLKCNVDKSLIMALGCDEQIPVCIINSGFKLVEKVKILGVNITKNFSDLTDNFGGVIEKINSIRNFWSRFNLSLPGRIAICKTFFLSQIGYLGCIQWPTEDQLQLLTGICEQFICGNLNISKQRLYIPPHKGGLGLINIKDYICALQAAWIKKIGGDFNDTWRFDLAKVCKGNLLLLDPSLLKKEEHPILHQIASSFRDFKVNFFMEQKNFWASPILYNPLLVNQTGSPAINDRWLNGNIPRLTTENLRGVKVSDIAEGWALKRLDEINDLREMALSLVNYMRLSEVWNATRNRLSRSVKNDGLACSLENFMSRFKKGSKSFRKVLLKKHQTVPVLQLRVTKTFVRLTNIGNIDEKNAEMILSFWNLNGLTNNVKDFCFKFFNNILGINTRVSHFNNNRDRGCDLCRRGGGGEAVPDETFRHLFFDCPVAKSLKKGFFRLGFQEWNMLTDEEWVKLWSYGKTPGTENQNNLFILCIIMLGNFYIWELKLRKNRGSSIGMFNEILFLAKGILGVNKNLENLKNNLNYAFCRNLEG